MGQARVASVDWHGNFCRKPLLLLHFQSAGLCVRLEVRGPWKQKRQPDFRPCWRAKMPEVSLGSWWVAAFK
jgi:hypothetical protein